MDAIANNNNRHTQEPFNYQKVLRTAPNLCIGEIHETNRNTDLYGQYSVRLLDHAGAIVACQLINQGGGFNGVGKIVPLEIDTPVVVLFREGQLDYGFIIGTFNTWGEYNKVYQDGELQEINTTDEYNQPFIHPNRLAQPDSIFEVYPDKTRGDKSFNAAESIATEERGTNRAKPGVIKLHNTSGDYVVYTPGQNIQYSEGNIIQVSGGSKAKRVAKLTEYAQAHLNKADNLKPLELCKTELDYSDTDFQPLTENVLKANQPTSKYLNLAKGDVNDEYLFVEEYKLATAYLEQAKVENSRQNSLQEEVDRVGEAVDEEDTEDGKITGSKYKPKIKNSSKLSENKILTESEDAFKYIVFHNAGSDLDEALADIQDPSNAKGYHILINKDNLINLAATNQRVNSVFSLSYDGDKELDKSSYSVGFITNKNKLNKLDYKTAAYQIKKLINDKKIDTDVYLTHQFLQESNNVAVKDKLTFDLNLFQKYLEEFV